MRKHTCHLDFTKDLATSRLDKRTGVRQLIDNQKGKLIDNQEGEVARQPQEEVARLTKFFQPTQPIPSPNS